MKRLFLIAALMVAVGFSGEILGQSTKSAADARKEQQEKFNQFKKERQQKYRKFMEEMNADYEKFMRQKWEHFKGNDAVKKPKPEPEPEPVIYEDKEEKPIEDRKVPVTVEPKPEPLPEPKPVVVVEEVPVTVETTVGIDFYGANLSFRYDRANNVSLASADEDGVADAWHKLSDGRMNNLTRDCFDARKERDLCDWAYYQMVDKLAGEIYSSHNEKVVAETFIMCQSGFKALMGRDDNARLYMLVATSSNLYGFTYWIVNAERYYSFEKNLDDVSLHILAQTFPEAKSLRLDVSGENRFGETLAETRHLKSEDYPQVTADVRSNKNLMKFYDTYPSSYADGNFMTKWWFYAMTPMDKAMSDNLYPALRRCIGDASEKDKVSMLLNFVQTAFEYGYDDKVWGGDRAFFAEETIYYPFSDCEDRSILFSRLVRDLVGLDVALVYYPGHLATAVAFNNEVSGDYFVINGKRFTVCDPTYIHAPIGLTMTGMDNSQAKVIVLR